MRFERLDLLAFGNFTGVSLDMTPATRPLQMILGANAAGKSTALRALADLLFGIPERTADDFVHRKQDLRIGAVISSSDGRTLSFVRRKGRAHTLLDGNGNALPDTLLTPFLGAADRGLFESMFGLGHERLRRGAQELLRAGGALGESLFDAAGGATAVRGVLAELSEDAGKVFKPRASTPLLNAAIARYRKKQQQARADGVNGRDFRDLETEMAELTARTERLGTDAAKHAAERRKLERIARNLPRASRLARLQDELAALAGVPRLAASAREDRLATTARRSDLEKRVAAMEQEIARLREALARLDVPDEVLAHAASVKDLLNTRAVVRKAGGDLPNRRAELESSRTRAAELLARVRPGATLADADPLRLPAPRVQRIRELAKRHTALRAEREAAIRKCKQAATQLAAAEARLAASPANKDFRPLADVLRRVRPHGDLERQIAELTRKVARLESAVTAQANALPGWQGNIIELQHAAVPLPQSVQRLAGLIETAEREVQSTSDRYEDRRHELEETRAALAAFVAGGEVPSPRDLAAARARRDEGWSLIRRAYIDGTEDVAEAARAYDAERPLPSAYERAVGAADELADRLRADSDRVAQCENWRRQAATQEERATAAEEALRAARLTYEDLNAEWRALWSEAGVEARTPPEMAGWLERRNRIVEDSRTLAGEHDVHAQLVQRLETCQAELARALAKCGETPAENAGLEVLLATAERIIEEAEKSARQRARQEERVRERQATRQQAEEERRDAEERLARWKEDWQQAVAPLDLGTEVSPTQAEESLALLHEAFEQLTRATEHEHRIAKIDADAEGFAHAVSTLVADCAPDLARRPAQDAIVELAARVQKADRDAVSRKEKKERLAALERDLRAARDEREQTDRDLDAIVRRAGCTSLDQVEAVEEQAARRQAVETELRQLEEQLVDDGNGLDLPGVLAEMEGYDGDRVAAALAALDEPIRLLNEERDRDLRRLGQLQRDRKDRERATGSAAAAAQEAEEELATVRAHTLDFMRLRTAEVVLRDFVDRYRRQHQNPILARASELFGPLTAGTFASVGSDYDEHDRAVVVGVDAGGKTLHTDAMSDGTRDQLFLALRLAAVEQYLAAAEPLPFVADDLLVHFDDERARAAFRTLAEFSRKTQVLFFTHHRHLIDLAREVVPQDLLAVQTIP